MRIDKTLEGLNKDQIEAVTATEGYVRVVAGAGSGKTKALVQRYLYLVNALGIDPSNILCVTFTNKAASEMRQRVRKQIEPGYDTGLITTYHGFCVRVLREDISHLRYPKNFLILDEEDQKMILREVYEELGLTIEYNTFNHMLKIIGAYKLNPSYVRGITGTEDFLEPDQNDINNLVIYKYLQKQKKVFGLDFHDLINFTFILYEDFPKVLRKWQEKLHYIQVDEFQDSSIRQIALVEMISKAHKNLFVVGDPDQTIYGWRGARPDFFIDFDKNYPTCKTVILNQNYRSTPEILNLGNAIIKKNKKRIDKDLFTKNSSGQKVIHYHGKSELDEYQWIVDQIKELVKNKSVSLNDIAILYRANYLSRYMEQALIKENIEYTMYGGIRFFQRREIKDALAYLRMVSAADDISFLRVVNNPRRNIGKKRIDFIKEQSEKNNISYYESLKKYIDNPLLKSTKADEFLKVIEKYRLNIESMSVSEILKGLLEDSGYDEILRLDGDQDRVDNISELFNSIVQYEHMAGEEVSLSEYLQDIALYTDLDQPKDYESIKMMTIHTAKGLEFPYVFLTSFTDGILPNNKALEERKLDGLEEERNLAYVAITRAEKAFFMTESEGFMNRGLAKYPSRFLLEVEESLFDSQGSMGNDFILEALNHIKISNEKLEDVSFQMLKVGQGISHPIFGVGEINEIDESKKVYKVKFQDMTELKSIRLDFKGLKKI